MFSQAMLKGKKRITLGAFLSMGLLGMSRTFLGTALGLIATGTGLGSMVIAWLISLVSQPAGLHTGFASLELVLLCCIALMIYHIQWPMERTASSPPRPASL